MFYVGLGRRVLADKHRITKNITIRFQPGVLNVVTFNCHVYWTGICIVLVTFIEKI